VVNNHVFSHTSIFHELARLGLPLLICFNRVQVYILTGTFSAIVNADVHVVGVPLCVFWTGFYTRYVYGHDALGIMSMVRDFTEVDIAHAYSPVTSDEITHVSLILSGIRDIIRDVCIDELFYSFEESVTRVVTMCRGSEKPSAVVAVCRRPSTCLKLLATISEQYIEKPRN